MSSAFKSSTVKCFQVSAYIEEPISRDRELIALYYLKYFLRVEMVRCAVIVAFSSIHEKT